MVEPTLQEMLQDLSVRADNYGQLASALSDDLIRVEQRLQSLAAKAEVIVNGGLSGSLAFRRLDGNWRLLWRAENGKFVPVQEASLSGKIAASFMIQELVRMLWIQQGEKIGQIEGARKALSQVIEDSAPPLHPVIDVKARPKSFSELYERSKEGR